MIEPEPTEVISQVWADRSCRDTGVEAFFPGQGSDDALAAKRVCAKCPRLRECAKWAQGAGLTYCVVAGVRMPSDGISRKHAMEQLRRVAETGAVSGLNPHRRAVRGVAA